VTNHGNCTCTGFSFLFHERSKHGARICFFRWLLRDIVHESLQPRRSSSFFDGKLRFYMLLIMAMIHVRSINFVSRVVQPRSSFLFCSFGYYVILFTSFSNHRVRFLFLFFLSLLLTTRWNGHTQHGDGHDTARYLYTFAGASMGHGGHTRQLLTRQREQFK
jgi:hypothetical protein